MRVVLYMLQLQAFKHLLMPTGEQQRQMRRFAGSCRFVFNQALALQQANRDAARCWATCATSP
ncbi:helix-turn-helix domain-containing protein [Pseudomonas monteilii]|uniref:helix-turn-helix domain-containing protein n=1 Tax=Pseudomonas monteilii TaxID=76759 RepID=UPI0006D9E60A|nr:hypothetical protein HB4184_27330 [Pseudomonas putida]